MAQVTRARALALGLSGALFLVGCPEPAPPPPVVAPAPTPSQTAAPPETTSTAEPVVTGDGTQASPYHLVPGKAQPLALGLVVHPEEGLVLQESADVVLTWGAGSLLVTESRQQHACGPSPCVLAAAVPGEIRLEMGSVKGPDKLAVTARALAAPKRVAVRPGKPFVLKTALVAPDDPRGPIADALLHFDAPGLQVIDVRAMGGKRTASYPDLLQKINIEIHGPAGPVSLHTSMSPDVGGALQIAFDSGAGDHVVRVAKQLPAQADVVEITLHKPSPQQNAAASSPPAVPPYAAAWPRLKLGAQVDFQVTAVPEPQSTWIDVPAGVDLALLWKPTVKPGSPGINLGSKTEKTVHLCLESPCIQEYAESGLHGVYALPVTASLAFEAEARLLPVPAATATLKPGDSVEVTTAAFAEGDPRGAMGHVTLDVDAEGTFQCTVTALDWSAPPAGSSPPENMPRIAAFTPEGKRLLGPVELVSAADIQSGIGHASLDAGKPGSYHLRLDGQGKAAARKLKVACERGK